MLQRLEMRRVLCAREASEEVRDDARSFIKSEHDSHLPRARADKSHAAHSRQMLVSLQSEDAVKYLHGRKALVVRVE